MKIGVPTEIKAQENRVALTPAGAERLVHAGHTVSVQAGAGLGSGLPDESYAGVGARILPSAAAVFGEADMILKVKEPLASEWPLLRKGQTLFTYLHLAASRELTDALVKTGAYCFADETLELNGELPLLTPMSEVAGRMAIQAGAKYLEKAHGGSGILLGGVPGVRPAKVLANSLPERVATKTGSQLPPSKPTFFSQVKRKVSPPSSEMNRPKLVP